MPTVKCGITKYLLTMQQASTQKVIFMCWWSVGTALGSTSCLSVYTSLQAHNILTHTDHTISHTLAHPSTMGFPSMLIIHFNEYIKQPFYCYSYYYE